MIPFAIPLALKTLPWRWFMYGAAALAVLLACWWVVDAIGDSREEKVRAEYEAAQRAAEAKAQADSWALVGDINAIDASVTAGKANTKKAEDRYAAVIQGEAAVFYLANPDCRPPYRLWWANDQLARELATASGLSVSALSGDQGAGQR
jgi:hypothetical protein